MFLYLIVVAVLAIAASIPTAELGIGNNLRLIVDVSTAGAGYVDHDNGTGWATGRKHQGRHADQDQQAR